jgi:hypothetical protein
MFTVAETVAFCNGDISRLALACADSGCLELKKINKITKNLIFNFKRKIPYESRSLNVGRNFCCR